MADSRAFGQRLGQDFYNSVQGELVDRMSAAGLETLMSTDPEDVAYLTGFFHHPSERPVAVWLESTGRCLLLLPALEVQHAEVQQARAELVEYFEYPGIESPFAVLARAVDPAVRRVGHPGSISYDRLASAAAALDPVRLEPSDLIMRARYVKRAEEIELHREAARITDVMLAAGVELVSDALASDGVLPSEAELAGHVGRVGTSVMHAEHSDVVVGGFLAGGLVYAGANSSFPHGLPSGYRLQPGDTFMLSLGCAVGGRFVEGERTFVLGEPDARQIRFHDAVASAQRVGRETIRPGMDCRTANRLCLEVLKEAGLGEYILHRQGHGIGLGMHEPPWLESGDATVLAEGMVVSNEPGIYVPGHAGYRISDSMLVTAGGAHPLTAYPRSIADCVISL